MAIAKSIRNGLRFLQGNVLVLTTTQALGMFCRGMVFPYASLYILALNGTSEQIGFVNSLRPLAGLFVLPIAGYLADHVGRVKLIALGSYLSGLVLLMYVLAPSWEWIAVAGLLNGFMVFHFPASSAILADSLSPKERGKGVATMNMFSGIMSIASPYLAGAVIDRYGENNGIRALYAVMMVFYLMNATINLHFLRETFKGTAERFDWACLPLAFKTAYKGIPALLRQFSPSLKAQAAIILLAATANAVAGPFWVVFATQRIGLGPKDWGLILLVETLCRNLLYLPAGLLVDRYGRTKFLIGSLLVLLASAPLFTLATSFARVMLARISIAAVNAFFSPACAALLADTVPRDIRGQVMAALGRGSIIFGASSGSAGGPAIGFLLTIPVMVGSLAGGYLYSENPALPWVFLMAAASIALLLSARYLRDPQEAEA